VANEIEDADLGFTRADTGDSGAVLRRVGEEGGLGGVV